jgi:hypothetical protein
MYIAMELKAIKQQNLNRQYEPWGIADKYKNFCSV